MLASMSAATDGDWGLLSGLSSLFVRLPAPPCASVTVRGGGSGVLWKPEETSKGIGQVGVMLLQAPLHLEGLEQQLKLPHVVDCSPNNRCLISLENFYEKNNEIMNKQNVMDEEKNKII